MKLLRQLLIQVNVLNVVTALMLLYQRPEKVKMPNVIGLPKEEALQKLKSLGLKDVTIEKVYNNQAPKGYIANQSVTANTEIAIHDSNIKLYESLGINKFMKTLNINPLAKLKSLRRKRI